MQQQKENLTAEVNGTLAEQRALEREAAALKLALGNITSSLHQLALTDAGPSLQPNQTRPSNHTPEVSVDSTSRVRTNTKTFAALLYRTPADFASSF